MVTFEQRPRRSEGVTFRGKRVLDEETTAGTDTECQCAQCVLKTTRSPMWLEEPGWRW